jgi:flagellar motility protein MotE (MotC chaperone)
VQEWVAKRDTILKAASDNLVAIYAKMQPETAAAQIAAMDDQIAAALLSKLKPSAAGAILNEMEAERASKLAAFLSAAAGGEKKS